MVFKRDRDDYVHHHPKSSSSSSTSSTTPSQFTWLEMIWGVIVTISYLLGYGIQISIIVERYSLEEPPHNRALYVVFFLLPHILAGLKNLQYHYRDTQEFEEENTAIGWIINFVFLPFSPLIRFSRAFRFGMKEKENWEYGVRFIDELVTAGVLRLFEVFLGDGPTLVLLVRDDVWYRSDDWSMQIMGPPDLLRCGPVCQDMGEKPIDFWTVFRMLFLLSKMAQCVTFYLVIIKRLQRLQYPEKYRHLRGPNARQGRLNIFATLLLYLAHFFFIGSRILGYSMVSASWGTWVYLIVGLHWLLNSAWHLVTVLKSEGLTPARSWSSLVMGGVWLMCLTNEQGGRQLGRFIMYYSFAFVESAICGYMWVAAMKGSGDFFEAKAAWAMLVVYLIGVVIHLLYYTLCHPGSPSITSRGLLCCSGNRWDPVDDQHP